jgi:hypothetical protein
MPELKGSYQPLEKTTIMSSMIYALPLEDIILIPEKSLLKNYLILM